MNRTTGAPAPRPEADRDTTSLAELVVGVDGTYAAGEALGWAARIARKTGAALTAVYAWQPGLGDSTSGHERATAHRRHQLHQWCQPARDAGVEVRAVVGDGDLFDVLASTLNDGGGRGRHIVVLGRAATGSGIPHDFDHQADNIARHLRVPLAVAPSPGAGRQLRRVVLGVGGSASAHSAATWLAAVAGGLDLEVHVVTAFEPMVEWVPRSSATSVWAKVRDQLDGQWTAPLRRAGVDYSTHLIEGINVANTLVDCARRRHADAVIVGLGDSAANRRRHPGTDLLERCHLPVILVPVDKTEMVEERQ